MRPSKVCVSCPCHCVVSDYSFRPRYTTPRRDALSTEERLRKEKDWLKEFRRDVALSSSRRSAASGSCLTGLYPSHCHLYLAHACTVFNRKSIGMWGWGWGKGGVGGGGGGGGGGVVNSSDQDAITLLCVCPPHSATGP